MAAFLDELEAGPCGLVPEGEAGIGKATVWAEVAARGQKGAQRHALAVALLREQPGPGRLDQRAVSAAVLSVLRTLAAAAPLLVAIDDLQWLDRPSARVLEFALRRLGRLPVGVLACERLGEGAAVPLDVNYINLQTADEDDTRMRAAYRDNLGRLARIKAAYDPDNLFRVNRNIAPAA